MHRALILVFALPFAVSNAHASACAAREKTATQRWTIDHYIYDASLKHNWEVLIDCDHPAAPARMKLAPDPSGHAAKAIALPVIKAGTAVEVSGAPGSPATIQLSGTALETAFAGQPIRVRLSAGNRLVTGLVRSPHSVELASAAKAPRWSER